MRTPAPRRGGRRLAVIVAAAAAVLVVAGAAGAVTFMGSDKSDKPVSIDSAASDGASSSEGTVADAEALAGLGAGPSGSASAAGKPGATATKGGSNTNAGPGAPPIAAAAGKQWKTSFSEEFTGTSLNTSKLSPCFDWNTGDCTSTFNDGREHYQPSQVVVSGGTAKLIAAPLSPAYKTSACQNGACTYKAGLLSTARPNANAGSKYLYAFTYGYVESRFKFPATQGFFTAFWMLPTDTSYNYKTELDILEELGDDPSTMYMTYHYNNREESFAGNSGKHNNGKCAAKDYSKDFVRMGVDWEPDHIAWYIDGVECARFTDASVIEKGPMQLILHMMVDNNWQRRWNVGLTDPTLTRQLEVDYIRVYQQTAA
ncbi:family 16 glycosylhydrolase [Dactylosporangium sp. NPDC051541]|uniref:glycoside hydrolase family 16 protein n=1 Tax=Dactylosporangium sp. NPDC051541 TaxID=3363977 RepID=UPI00379D31E0